MGRAKGWAGKLSEFGEYLKKHGLDRDVVAGAAGVTPSYVSMLAHGKANPGFKRAVAIERWTHETVKDSGGRPAPFSCVDWDV